MPSWSKSRVSKSISVHDTEGHAPSARCSGVKPVTTSFDFTPAELGLAAAFCANRYYIPKRLQAAHIRSMSAMIDLHVDASGPDFALESSAGQLKDFVGSYLTGVIATGLGYLFMEAEGYVWCGHFEDAAGGDPTATRSPDFVFEHGLTHDLALTESKGTRKPGGKSFARLGYKGQVAPHLGYSAFGRTATHGFCIGARLGPSTKADLVVIFTEPAAPPVAGLSTSPLPPQIPPSGPSPVQRASFDRAMELVFGPPGEIDDGERRTGRVPWKTIRPNAEWTVVEWAGRQWIVSKRRRRVLLDDDWPRSAPLATWAMYSEVYGIVLADTSVPPIDAVRWGFDKAVFAAFQPSDDGGERDGAARYCINPEILATLRVEARSQGGAVLANGLALIPDAAFRRPDRGEDVNDG